MYDYNQCGDTYEAYEDAYRQYGDMYIGTPAEDFANTYAKNHCSED